VLTGGEEAPVPPKKRGDESVVQYAKRVREFWDEQREISRTKPNRTPRPVRFWRRPVGYWRYRFNLEEKARR